jgi:hypothetical protein
VETYATPYDRAKALLDDFIAFATSHDYPLPTRRYAQVGEVVRDCASVIVSVNSITPDPGYDPVTCVFPRASTFLVDVIRDCAVVYNDDGITNVPVLEEVSEIAAADGQLLYDFGASIDGWTSKAAWSVVWAISEGGQQVASLQITIGVP